MKEEILKKFSLIGYGIFFGTLVGMIAAIFGETNILWFDAPITGMIIGSINGIIVGAILGKIIQPGNC